MIFKTAFLIVQLLRYFRPCITDTYYASVGGYVPLTEHQPWVVGVHKLTDGEYQHICGGSLISSDVVVSAAHCFWDDSQPVNIHNFRISAGNFYRSLNKSEPHQEVDVRRILFHERYRSYYLNYAHDIVIVQLETSLQHTPYVQPIDVDWNPVFDDDTLKEQIGTVVGWGFTDNDQPSVTRVAVNLPYVEFSTCYETVPREFRPSITADKFCAGLRNGTAVCPGDSGGGLVFLDYVSGTWYVRGIVSVGVVPDDNSKCHRSQYTAFTSISKHSQWLRQQLDKLKDPLESGTQLQN